MLEMNNQTVTITGRVVNVSLTLNCIINPQYL